jgi:UDP-N-acetylglucosamine--N-acetylmuramyl-(pentapeptide) pyrophosphoryl-undecaprenol N-acetylglucosamine transferase
LVSSVLEARRIIKDYKPDLIVGTGGYVSGPVMFIGALMGVKTAVHEANAFPGRANKMLSHFVDKVMISFEESKQAFKSEEKVVLTGNPVRQEFYGLDKTSCRERIGIDAPFMLLSAGGSGGAKKINDVMIEIMTKLSGREDIKIIHVTGKSYYEKFMKQLKDMRVVFDDNINIIPYVYDMPGYMGAADLMITRTGASTLAEIGITGTPALLIPSPNVKDNHQEYNARSMEKIGAGVVMLEKDLNAGHVLSTIEDFASNPQKLDQIRKNCARLPGKEALDIIVQTLEKLLKESD